MGWFRQRLWLPVKYGLKGLVFSAKATVGREVPRALDGPPVAVERHGDIEGGWCIRAGSLTAASVVYSAGVGDNITFDESLIARYGCAVHGFDPTPKAQAFIAARRPPQFHLHVCGLAGSTRLATFRLPKNEQAVSGSILESNHLQPQGFDVALKSLADLMQDFGHDRIDLLKMDIEGAEYEVIDSIVRDGLGSRINQILVEFHHRFTPFTLDTTRQAIAQLQQAGYRRAWISNIGEEYLFVREHS